MAAERLQLSNVDKIYNEGSRHAVRAVAALDMSIADGEIVALLGSSGCGKTSTLRMIAGFEPVTSGEIRLGGNAIHTLPPARRQVAMAFEGYSLYPPLTVRQNIDFALKAQRVPAVEIDRRVNEIAALLEINDILERYPSSISGGQQQRASLARALIRDAGLHLLDEPMGQLEPQLRALLRGRIKHFIRERGLTAILVTHDQTEANALADRIAVMEAGTLQQFASPDELRDRPANLFTGTFIGEPPMNVFAATVSRQDKRLVFDLGGGRFLGYPIDGYRPELKSALLYAGQVTIGVRPHAVRLVGRGLPATVTNNQWLGDQSHIATEFAGGTVVAVSHQRRDESVGDEVYLQLAAADLHVFDAASGQAIAHGTELA